MVLFHSYSIPSAAQDAAARPSRWEIRVGSGRLIPTGDQRRILKPADLTAAQVAWVVRPSFAITGTFGWARSRDLGSLNAPKLDAFTSDLGVELRPAPWFAGRVVTFSPLVGLGGGARSYNYRSVEADATHNLSGYAALGGEFGARRVALRLELRDYASGFKPLVGAGTSDTRNDVVVMAALRFKRHAAAHR
ncbi:MAG: hypothetical protein ABIZ91_11975 [Gemmatimonadaceae bacterium]